MIVWLNGTFGAGKTSTARELLPLLPGARFFDPETVGYWLRHQDIFAGMPRVKDFQDQDPWRPLVAEAAIQFVRYTGGPLVAPQTLLRQEYQQEIFGRFLRAQVPTFLVLLEADEQVMRQRIEAADEVPGDAEANAGVRTWRLRHLSDFLRNRAWMAAAADLVVDTTDLTPREAAATVVKSLPPARA